MKEIPLLTLAAMALLVMLGQPYAASSIVISANVMVVLTQCPFGVAMSMLPAYPFVPEIRVNYTVFATSSCQVQNPYGTFQVFNQVSNVLVYQQPVNVIGNNQFQVSNYLLFSTSNMVNTTYVAVLTLSQVGNVATGSNTFSLLNYANVVITQFSAPQSVSVGAPVSFGVSMQNFGESASSPITLMLSVSGPQSFNAVYPFPALSPGQSSNTVITLTNASAYAGTYDVSAFASYNSLGTPANSPTVTASYSVAAPQQGAGPSPSSGIPANYINLPPGVDITYLPLLLAGPPGRIEQSQLGIRNTGLYVEQVNISVPDLYSGLLGFSTYSFSVSPNETTTVQVFLQPNLTMQTGVYTIPINLSVSYQDGTVANATEYLTFSLYRQNATQPSVSTQMYLINSTGTASGVISIIAPQQSDLTNATLVQWIPASVAPNASDLSFFGLPTSVTLINGTYRVDSYISSLPRNQTIYEYYSIKSASNPQVVLRSQYAFYTVSAPKPGSILKLVGISAPAIVGNTIGDITVSVFYTGTEPAEVDFSMVPPPQVVLQNDTQNVTVVPNQLIMRQFKVTGHPANGTFILQLYIRTEGANLSYGVPIVIAPPAAAFRPLASAAVLPLYFRVAIFIVLIVAVIALLWGHLGGRQKYSRERAGSLIRIKEQIKREE
jgi:hypothetical protein